MQNIRESLIRRFIGKMVTVTVDRPIGTEHPKREGLIYPVNYGYIDGVFSADGEELDVYILGISEPVAEFTGKIVGVVRRKNDIEDKLIVAPDGYDVTKDEMTKSVHFQERFYDYEVDEV